MTTQMTQVETVEQGPMGQEPIGGGDVGDGSPPYGEPILMEGQGPMGQEPIGGGDVGDGSPPYGEPILMEGQGPMEEGVEDGSPPHGEPEGGEMGQGPMDGQGGQGQMGPEGVDGFQNKYAQFGGDGFRLGVDAEMVGGQAVVEGYDNEQATCGGYGEELAPQEGGGSPFNFITDPDSGTTLSIFSGAGKALLKSYVKAYKHMQSGGAALLEGVDANATGALYDGVQNAGAESLPGACDVTYDAQGDNWTHTQVGGGDKKECGCDGNCEGDCECNNNTE
jgi:hypothetical protein